MIKTENPGEKSGRQYGDAKLIDAALVRGFIARALTSVRSTHIRDVSTGTRVGTRRVSYLDFSLSLMESPQLTGVNAPVLLSAWPNGAPTTSGSMFTDEGKSVFSANLLNVVPIQKGGRKRVSHNDCAIREENERSLHYPVNRLNNKKDKQNWGHGSQGHSFNIYQNGIGHAGTDQVCGKAVKIRATGSQQLCVSARSSQSSNWSISHE